jgi:hypothetical protein
LNHPTEMATVKISNKSINCRHSGKHIGVLGPVSVLTIDTFWATGAKRGAGVKQSSVLIIDTFTDSGLLPHTRLKVTMEKRATGAVFEVTLEGRRPFLALERRRRPNLPRSEFGRVRNPPRIVLDEALFQIGSNTCVDFVRA